MDPKSARISVPTFVKWAGGKTQLLGEYRKYFPKVFERYFEPFLGSGAVFFYLKSILEKKGASKRDFVLTDVNSVLINGFVSVRDAVNKLLSELKRHAREHHKDPRGHYYETRQNFRTSINKEDFPDLVNAADFIYLNKTCFNGLYRVNSQGKFNVPMGSYEKPSIVQERNLLKASRLLEGVELNIRPYDEVLRYATVGDFVYFDPPYQPLSKTSSFTSYTSGSFSEDDQRNLFKVFDELAKRGCLLMLSNSAAPLITDLYSGYKVEEILAKRMISCKGDGRGAIKEVIILNTPNTSRESTKSDSQENLLHDYASENRQ
ncbi:MAG: DNA adenine methylase [Promethearchaeati archaeon SRVP18_Atabeyarchaeia-1]